DPIRGATAFLFRKFSDGLLTGYDYTPGPGRVASADALQHVLWFLEDEETTAAGGWTIGDNSLMDKFYQIGIAGEAAAPGSLFNVRVLNPNYFDGVVTVQAQSVLIITDQASSVPV